MIKRRHSKGCKIVLRLITDKLRGFEGTGRERREIMLVWASRLYGNCGRADDGKSEKKEDGSGNNNGSRKDA